VYGKGGRHCRHTSRAGGCQKPVIGVPRDPAGAEQATNGGAPFVSHSPCGRVRRSKG
jgi:hypothetical protein